VAEHPKVFGHVGLLFNQPPGKAELLFINHYTARQEENKALGQDR